MTHDNIYIRNIYIYSHQTKPIIEKKTINPRVWLHLSISYTFIAGSEGGDQAGVPHV